jgi:aspartate/methionine/tyrosine aminotransferase
VSTPVQVALPGLFDAGSVIRRQIQRRIRENLSYLATEARHYPECSVLPVDAGWYAVVQIPSLKSEEETVIELLDRTGVLVHPGYFFDFEREAFVIISLLPDSERFASGVRTLLAETARGCRS